MPNGDAKQNVRRTHCLSFTSIVLILILILSVGGLRLRLRLGLGKEEEPERQVPTLRSLRRVRGFGKIGRGRIAGPQRQGSRRSGKTRRHGRQLRLVEPRRRGRHGW